MNSAYSNWSRYQISAETDNFDFFGPNLPKKSIFSQKRKKWAASLSSAYSNYARCQNSRCYGTSRPIKRELTIYGTSRPREVNKNAMALLGQSRDSWPPMAPLGQVELTKMQKLLESKNKIEKQNENKNENSFLFWFSFLFLFSLWFLFLLFIFVFTLVFGFVVVFHFRFRFCFCFCFSFLVFIFKFYYGTSRPPYSCTTKALYLTNNDKPKKYTDLLILWLTKIFQLIFKSRVHLLS